MVQSIFHCVLHWILTIVYRIPGNFCMFMSENWSVDLIKKCLFYIKIPASHFINSLQVFFKSPFNTKDKLLIYISFQDTEFWGRKERGLSLRYWNANTSRMATSLPWSEWNSVTLRKCLDILTQAWFKSAVTVYFFKF